MKHPINTKYIHSSNTHIETTEEKGKNRRSELIKTIKQLSAFLC